MPDDAPPELPELDRSTGELATLTEMLDYYRSVLLRKAWGLSDAQLAGPMPVSDLTIGGILVHMALVEDSWFDHRFVGNEELEPWVSFPWDDDHDYEFHTAHEWSFERLVSQFNESVARSHAAVEGAESLDQIGVRPAGNGEEFSLRWMLVHMIEEYARHCGHADLLRQSIDGSTGD